ncbi:acetyl-CoA carboxylase biotin carboxylase subunit family protein [Psychrobacter sp. ANT_H59]|uniref:ATP-grasp domain-containing protein n=1 Tax=Psychrobacter sp. ANT_H59 TaxID=2597354 RepID=UPI0011EEEB50|nr:ATP-grasp domain-containing protein [Psychrobacter sp. ANT_H59]KAA0939502.1 ATP-grasp domain-containing protein [Psychrobacter sp. ANT_H59]
MTYSTVLITHVVNDAVIKGFIPALLKSRHVPDSQLIIITDDKEAHMDALIATPLGAQISILECDVFNPLAIIDTLNNYHILPNLVFSNSDHLQAATAVVAEFFHLPSKDWRHCLVFKDKYLMRTQLHSAYLYQAGYQLLSAKDLHLENLSISFPLVAKPKQGVASMDVQLCMNKNELLSYCQSFWQSKTLPILVESYVAGRLITLEILGDGESLVAVGGFEVTLTEPPHFVELDAVWNTPLCVQYRERCLSILQDIGVGLGVCHSEFIITPTGEVHLVEINYRSIGDGREFLLHDMAHYPWFDTIVRLHQGVSIAELEAEFGSLAISTHARIHYIVAPQSGTICIAPSPFNKQMQQTTIIHQPLKKQHQTIHITHSNKDYLSRLLAYSDCANTMNDVLNDAIANLQWQFES